MVIVGLIRNRDPYQAVQQVLEIVQAKSLLQPTDKVLIKPNYLSSKHPSTGITTDTRVVWSIIRFVKRCGVSDIVVGDGGLSDTEKVFDVVGIREVAEKEGIPLIDLNRDKRVKVHIPGATALKEVAIAQTVLEYPVIINVPKLKIHHMAKVTLGIKNLMGAITPKSIIHKRLDEKLADLASFLRPRLTIVDGSVGCEKDELSGNPVTMDVVIGGQDIVAVDVVGSLVMGVDPREVGYIGLAAKKGIGIMNLREIQVIGDEIEAVRKHFER